VGFVVTDKERERLVALLGMMGSSGDGEALNAARLAQRFITDRKLTWNDVIAVQTAEKTYDPYEEMMRNARQNAARNTATHQEKAAWLLKNYEDKLSNVEKKNFVRDMVHWMRPSPKQQTWLDRIYARYNF
jgi:hypothetical protein